MKRIFLLSLVFLCKISFAQQVQSFELTKNGIEPIVITVDSLNANGLYKRTISWVQEFYKDQKNALKTDVGNQKILVDGTKKSAWFYASSNITTQYDVEYILTIEFQDNKMTMDIELARTWDNTEGKKANSYFIDYRKIWKENGELHNIYKEAKPGIDQMMNELSHSLVNYLRDYNEIAQNNKNEKSRIWQKTKF